VRIEGEINDGHGNRIKNFRVDCRTYVRRGWHFANTVVGFIAGRERT
jgi:hypothetical protein